LPFAFEESLLAARRRSTWAVKSCDFLPAGNPSAGFGCQEHSWTTVILVGRKNRRASNQPVTTSNSICVIHLSQKMQKKDCL
jgi:hypothetical protein